MQTVAETPSSLRLAPQPPPSGPKLARKNSEVLVLMPCSRRDHQIGVMAGDDAIRNHRRQRLEHRVDDGHRIGHPPAHRRRPHRADDAAGRHDGLEAAERAVVDRIIGRRGQALVGHLRAGVAGGDAGIVEAAHLARDVGEIDRHLVALDDDAHLDRHLLADVDAVVVHVGLRLIDAVRDRARARARHRLGMIHDGLDGAQHLRRGRSGRPVRGSAARRSSPP